MENIFRQMLGMITNIKKCSYEKVCKRYYTKCEV
jgi:hypothetical protein